MPIQSGGGAIGFLWRPGSGGSGPACSFVAGSGISNSSYDVFGNYYNAAWRYVATNFPVTQTVSGPFGLYGTANEAAGAFGVNTGVTDPGTMDARWAWDLLTPGGIATFCKTKCFGTSGGDGNTTLEYSDDGVTWSTALTFDGTIQDVADIKARYWSMHTTAVYSGGFFAGRDYQSLMLWARA